MPEKPSRAKWIVQVGISIFLLLTILVAISQILFNNRARVGQYSLAESIILSIGLVGAAIAGMTLSIKAWAKNADEYYDWYVDQKFFTPLISQPKFNSIERVINLWAARLGGPIIVMIAITIPILLIGSALTRLIAP